MEEVVERDVIVDVEKFFVEFIRRYMFVFKLWIFIKGELVKAFVVCEVCGEYFGKFIIMCVIVICVLDVKFIV